MDFLLESGRSQTNGEPKAMLERSSPSSDMTIFDDALSMLIIAPIRLRFPAALQVRGRGGVVMERLFLPRPGRGRAALSTRRVVEPELDMHRVADGGPSVWLARLVALMRWMVPGGRPIAPPMRSVDRELWEISNDR